MFCVLSVTAWNMTCCLPALLALWRLDHGRCWWWQHWQCGGGSCGDDDGIGGNAILQLQLQSDEHDAGPELPVWNCMQGELWIRCFFRRQGTLRVCSQYPPELACYLWLNPGVFDLGVLQPVCGLVRGLRPWHPVPVACRLCHPHRHWTRGLHPHAPTGPCHCALRPWCWVL